MGTPKTVYSDQGSEFKNKTVQNVLDKHNIQIIFTLSHAPFIEAFNVESMLDSQEEQKEQ